MSQPIETFAPGQTVKMSGQYVQLDADGKIIRDASGEALQATLTKGEPYPPSDAAGFRWKLADPTHHAVPEDPAP